MPQAGAQITVHLKAQAVEVRAQKRARPQALGIDRFNIHPGTTGGMCTPEVCMAKIAEGVNRALAETSGVCVVLENVAGQARRSAWQGP